MRQTCYKLFFTSLVFFFAGYAFAENIIVQVDYGAFQAPATDKLFSEISIMDPRIEMPEPWLQARMLLEAFPDVAVPDVSEAKVLFVQGKEAYFNGDFEDAVKKLEGALDLVEKNIIWMTLAPGFSDDVFEGGAYLLQIYLYGLDDADSLVKNIDRIIRLFPTREPKGDYFPQELAEQYRERMPSQRLGHNLKVETSSECETRLNGQIIPPEMAKDGIKLYSGTYAVSKTCGNQIVRAFVVPIYSSETVNFEDDFSRAFTYPRNKVLRATASNLTMDILISHLALIGKRVGAKHIIGVGMAPEDHPFMPEGYTAILVDVEAEEGIRARAAKQAELIPPDNMKDFVNSLWTGDSYTKLTESATSRPVLNAGIALSYIGGATLIAATTLAVFAKKENENYTKLNKIYENRASDGKLKESIQRRDRLSLSADIMFGISGGLLAAGIAMIVTDVILYKKKAKNNLFYSAFDFGISIQRDALQFGLEYKF
ncbi:MAG: hypothetical protein WC966_08180 [Bradymonadales bacterium]